MLVRRARGGSGQWVPNFAVGAFADNSAGAGHENDRVIVLEIAIDGAALAVDGVVDGEMREVFGIELGGVEAEAAFGGDVELERPAGRIGAGDGGGGMKIDLRTEGDGTRGDVRGGRGVAQMAFDEGCGDGASVF